MKPDLANHIIGIDGEGWDTGPMTENGRDHVYGLIVAADERGQRWQIHNNGSRITSKQCLDFLFKLPQNRLIISFSFKYDLTKMLEDLPDEILYNINHTTIDYITEWQPIPHVEPYIFSYLGNKFVVEKDKKKRVIWDFFKFYQASFIKALKTWEVGLKDLEVIEKMKKKRGEFKPSELPEIAHYCYLECVNLSHLGRKLIVSLEKAGLDLDNKYYGAGSVGGAVLKRMKGEEENILSKVAIPLAMRDATKRAFFGGRFEISQCGPLKKTCFERDISSAYPYQIYLIPCFRHTCGKWINIKNRSELNDFEYGVIRYSLLDKPTRNTSWGPFPYRTPRSAIVFPATSGGGWVWMNEYRQGEKLWDNVKFEEGWVWQKNKNCNHTNPFKDIAHFYNERCRLGKDGAGIVIKLGYNASYGKTAQTVGNAIYHNWVWAGMTTSGCRAQLLHLMGLHKDMNNIFMLATDGLYSTENMTSCCENHNHIKNSFCDGTPEPVETGTGPEYLVNDKGVHINKPLGGWETNELPYGMFLVRPGIYFKLNKDGDVYDGKDDGIKKIRSRGIGTSEMSKARTELMEHFAKTNGSEPFSFKLTRFHGMKTGIGAKSVNRIFPSNIKDVFYRRECYGKWAKHDHVLSFNSLPKRDPGFLIRKLPDPDLVDLSAPYSKMAADELDAETIEARLTQEMLLEQPDYDDGL